MDVKKTHKKKAKKMDVSFSIQLVSVHLTVGSVSHTTASTMIHESREYFEIFQKLVVYILCPKFVTRTSVVGAQPANGFGFGNYGNALKLS